MYCRNRWKRTNRICIWTFRSGTTESGTITMNGKDITHMPIRERLTSGMSHIPEDRHKHGLVLDYSLEDNIVLQRYFEPQFTNKLGFLKRKEIRKYANRLIEQYDIRSGQGAVTKARSMSGGNQQKAIIAREIDKKSGASYCCTAYKRPGCRCH